MASVMSEILVYVNSIRMLCSPVSRSAELEQVTFTVGGTGSVVSSFWKFISLKTWFSPGSDLSYLIQEENIIVSAETTLHCRMGQSCNTRSSTFLSHCESIDTGEVPVHFKAKGFIRNRSHHSVTGNILHCSYTMKI